MKNPTESNRDRALRAALAIAGSQGLRAVTHGRIDSTAALPKGTTSNHFRTRAGLLHATVDHLVEAEQNTFAGGTSPESVDDLLNALVQFIRDSEDTHRDLTTARYAFFVEGFHDPHIRDTLAQARRQINVWAAQSLEVVGVTRPFAVAARILTYVDGAILHSLTFGSESVEIAEAKASILALIDAGRNYDSSTEHRSSSTCL